MFKICFQFAKKCNGHRNKFGIDTMELSSIEDGGKAELLRSSGDAARLLLTEWRDCVFGIPAAAGTAVGTAAGA